MRSANPDRTALPVADPTAQETTACRLRVDQNHASFRTDTSQDFRWKEMRTLGLGYPTRPLKMDADAHANPTPKHCVSTRLGPASVPFALWMTSALILVALSAFNVSKNLAGD